MKGPRRSGNAQIPHVEAVARRCQVCEWEGELIQPVSAEPDCPWCHAPTTRIATLAASPVATANDVGGSKNPHAAALGRLGGAKGGRARAQALTAKERRQIASRAARARWTAKKKKKKKTTR